MIPKRRIPPRPEPAPVADDAPPVEHRAVDWDFALTNGATIPITIVDGAGVLNELADRYVYEQGAERIEILKSAILYVRRVERVYHTFAPAIVAPTSQ